MKLFINLLGILVIIATFSLVLPSFVNAETYQCYNDDFSCRTTIIDYGVVFPGISSV